MPPTQRGVYQRALSADAKPMGVDGPAGGGLAMRRNVPCPTLVKQENMDAPIRSGAMPNGFPGGMGVCPPRGNPSNLNTYFSAGPTQSGFLCTTWCDRIGSMEIFVFSAVFHYGADLTDEMVFSLIRRYGQRYGDAPAPSHGRTRGVGDAKAQWKPRVRTRSPRHGSLWPNGWTHDQPLQQRTCKPQVHAATAAHGYGYVTCVW